MASFYGRKTDVHFGFRNEAFPKNGCVFMRESWMIKEITPRSSEALM